jgi:hypothetical protein
MYAPRFLQGLQLENLPSPNKLIQITIPASHCNERQQRALTSHVSTGANNAPSESWNAARITMLPMRRSRLITALRMVVVANVVAAVKRRGRSHRPCCSRRLAVLTATTGEGTRRGGRLTCMPMRRLPNQRCQASMRRSWGPRVCRFAMGGSAGHQHPLSPAAQPPAAPNLSEQACCTSNAPWRGARTCCGDWLCRVRPRWSCYPSVLAAAATT